jgi:hypothetical protein
MPILATIANKFIGMNYVTVMKLYVFSGNYFQLKGGGGYQALGLPCTYSDGYGR